jgi:hypothetical protein
LELGYVRAHRLDPSGHVRAAHTIAGRAEPEAHDPDEVRDARHQVPDALIDAGRMHAQEHFVTPRDGLGHVL